MDSAEAVRQAILFRETIDLILVGTILAIVIVGAILLFRMFRLLRETRRQLATLSSLVVRMHQEVHLKPPGTIPSQQYESDLADVLASLEHQQNSEQ